MSALSAHPLHLQRQLLCAYAAHEYELQAMRREPVPHFDLDDLLSGAEAFFANTARQPATVGSPFIVELKDVAFEGFTTVIRLTGTRRGAIYVTASRAMLTILLMRMGATDITVDAMSEALRRMAHAMAQAARANLSHELLLWSPTVDLNAKRSIDSSSTSHAVVVPLHWRKYTATVVMCIE